MPPGRARASNDQGRQAGIASARDGETYLSDLYYIWKSGNAPIYDAAFGGEPIRAAGRTFSKGIGAKGKCALMFMVDGRADLFRATVAMDDSCPEDAKEIDVALKDVQCLMLVFDGKNAMGNWADAHVTGATEDRTVPPVSVRRRSP